MGSMNEDKRMHIFPTPKPVRLRVSIPKGRIIVVAEETEETRVELTPIHGDAATLTWIEQAEVAQNGDEILVRMPKARLGLFGRGGSVEARVHAPCGSAASLSTGSGRIETAGRLSEIDASSGAGSITLDDNSAARARTGSGDIAIAASAGSVDAKTGSGRITVGKVGADAQIITGSGHAELAEAAGEARLTTGSGDIEISLAGDSLEAFAAAGNVRVRRADHGRVRAKTVSGHVSIGVASGAVALLDISMMSGRMNSELEAAAPPADGDRRVELIISTVSGNVNLTRV
jgi:hypothetical protein